MIVSAKGFGESCLGMVGLLAGLAIPSAFAEQIQPAFSISKETNSNLVRYDARLGDDCSFARDRPLDVYWLIRHPAGGPDRREALNFIERGLYGINLYVTEPHRLVGEVSSLERRRRKLPIRITSTKVEGRCQIATQVEGETLPSAMTLESLHLSEFRGMAPRKLAIGARDPRTGTLASYSLELR